MQVRIRLPMKNAGSLALFGRQRRQRLGHVRAAAIREHHAVGDLAGQRDHALAQGRQHDRRQPADILIGTVLRDKGADVAERLARGHAHPHVTRPVRDADAELEPPARHLVDIRGAVREFLDRLRIDRRDRGGEGDALGRERQPGTLRHVGVGTRHLDHREAAALDLAREVQRGAAASGFGDQVEGRHGPRRGGAVHRVSNSCVIDRRESRTCPAPAPSPRAIRRLTVPRRASPRSTGMLGIGGPAPLISASSSYSRMSAARKCADPLMRRPKSAALPCRRSRWLWSFSVLDGGTAAADLVAGGWLTPPRVPEAAPRWDDPDHCCVSCDDRRVGDVYRADWHARADLRRRRHRCGKAKRYRWCRGARSRRSIIRWKERCRFSRGYWGDG